MSIEAMKQAVEAFEHIKKYVTDDGAMPENWDAYHEKEYYALEALRQAIEQAEKQEKLCKYCGGIGRVVCNGRCMPEQEPVTTIETACALLRQAHDVLACASYPFKRPWVGLTDEEIKGILDCGRGGLVDIKKAEQILKERNNG